MSAEDVSTNIFSRKEILHRDTEKYKQAIEEQVDILKQNAGQISKVAIVIGGALAVSYLLVRLFTRGNRKNKKLGYDAQHHPVRATMPVYREESVFARTIKGYIATFLIALAQQKLQEVVAHLKATNANGDSKENI